MGSHCCNIWEHRRQRFRRTLPIDLGRQHGFYHTEWIPSVRCGFCSSLFQVQHWGKNKFRSRVWRCRNVQKNKLQQSSHLREMWEKENFEELTTSFRKRRVFCYFH